METVDITSMKMGLLYIFTLVPMAILFYLKIDLIGKLLLSVVRMSVQLILIGIYLQYLFKANNPLLNTIWLLIMTTVAASHVIKSASLHRKKLFTPILTSLLSSMGIILFLFIFGVIQPTPLYDARYLIPLGGMLLGNCLTANIIAIDAFSEAIKREKKEIQTALTFGATQFESVLPYIRSSIQKAVTPIVTTIGTLGLVSLPGMMTGQLLGGSIPVVAIKYQIAIMITILTVTTLSVFGNIVQMSRIFFDQRGNLREELYRK